MALVSNSFSGFIESGFIEKGFVESLVGVSKIDNGFIENQALPQLLGNFVDGIDLFFGKRVKKEVEF